MKRDVTSKLIKWARGVDKMPLLLTGIRQCGKTYAMKSLGKTEFNGNYAYFNFEQNADLADVFKPNLDPHRILDELSILHGNAVVPGETLLIFDEIQSCIPAITSLKYFCEELPKLHLLGAGSLLGVTLKEQSLSFPVGKVERLQMYPMNFSEFLDALNPRLLELLESRLDRGIALSESLMAPLSTALKMYYIIGGMPKAVSTWLDTKDLSLVEKIQDNILLDYQNDFSKHAPRSDVPKLGMIWDSIPVQLAKENNKFVFSHVKSGKRAADLEDALEWLEEAGLAHKLKLVEDVRLPLSHHASSVNFKLYMADVGLLRRKAGVSAATILQGNDDYREFKGALAENFVMQQLLAMGKEPYFWRSSNQAEVDFVLDERGKVIPIEVKAEVNTKAKSYTVFCERFQPQFGFKFSLKNVGDHVVNNTQTYSVPLYLMWKMDDWIKRELEQELPFDMCKYTNDLMVLDDMIDDANSRIPNVAETRCKQDGHVYTGER